MKIVILGAGGFAREVYWVAKACGYQVVAFFATDNHGQSVMIDGLAIPVRRTLQRGDFFTIGVGSPATKRKLVAAAHDMFATPLDTLVHPQAHCYPENSLGVGGVICPGAKLTTNIRLGSYVTVNLNSTIGHDAVIGGYTSLHPSVNVSGGATIEEGVLLGTGAFVRENVRVSRDATVGAGAVVTADVAPETTVVGIPAKPLG